VKEALHLLALPSASHRMTGHVGRISGSLPKQKPSPQTYQDVMKASLANAICVLAWTAPLFMLPCSIVLITRSCGFWGIAGGMAIMAILLGGPMHFAFRGVCFLPLAILALRSDAQAMFGAAWLLAMLFSITELPGLRKQWRPSPGFFNFITRTLEGRKYYKAAELRGALDEIKPGKNLFAVHPHGILTGGWTWNMFFNSDFHERTGRIGFLLDEGLRLKAPTFRLLCDWFEGKDRYAAPATKSAIKKAMDRGESLALLPGGFQEATICEPGKERVYVKSRQGFIKYCLQGGYRITPVYSFGETDTYWTFRPLLKFRLSLAKQNIPAAAMFGNPLCPLLPRREAALRTFVGSPLELPLIAEPTKEEVQKYHAKYVEALKEVFDKHKAEAGVPDAVLEIW